VLREHRGDGHFAALLAAGIDGCEAVVLRCGLDLRRGDMQPVRGWSDEQWEAATGRLAGRGLVDASGTITAAGREAHRAVEEATDRAAASPWDQAGPQTVAELRELLTPLAQACAQLLPYPNPIALPRPDSVA